MESGKRWKWSDSDWKRRKNATGIKKKWSERAREAGGHQSAIGFSIRGVSLRGGTRLGTVSPPESAVRIIKDPHQRLHWLLPANLGKTGSTGRSEQRRR